MKFKPCPRSITGLHKYLPFKETKDFKVEKCVRCNKKLKTPKDEGFITGDLEYIWEHERDFLQKNDWRWEYEYGKPISILKIPKIKRKTLKHLPFITVTISKDQQKGEDEYGWWFEIKKYPSWELEAVNFIGEFIETILLKKKRYKDGDSKTRETKFAQKISKSVMMELSI